MAKSEKRRALKPNPDSGLGGNSLTAELKLEIRQEVEKRLKELPAETLKTIQNEVSQYADRKFGHYRTIFVVVGIVVAIFFGFSFKDLRSRTREVVRIQTDVETIKTNTLALYMEMTNKASSVSASQISLQNRIHELEGMDNIVTSQRLEKELKAVDGLRMQVEDALLTSLRLAAIKGDAVAYDKLRAWSTNYQSRFAAAAMKAAADTVLSITGPFHPENATVLRVGTEWDLNIGYERSVAEIYRDAQPDTKVSVIEGIWKATNFPKADRMEFLVGAALHDTTIPGRVAATRLLNEETKLGFNAANPEPLENWWKTNKVNYGNR
jgi:hypothetical protein